MVSSAQAVQLVVMSVATHATNSIIPAGEQVVTFGVQVKAADLVGAGTNPVLVVQDVTFAGNGLTTSAGIPFNQGGLTNIADVSAAQSIVNGSYANQAGPDLVPAVQTDLALGGQRSLYADSWWYGSGSGTLTGVNSAAGTTGTLPSAWQLGPISAIGPTAFVWNSGTGVQAGDTANQAVQSPTGTNATVGQYMMFTGLYGPNGSNALTQSTLASQFVNGVLTVPLAQIVTTGDIQMPGTYSNAGGGVPSGPGTGTYLGLIGDQVSNGPTGNGTYNLQGNDPTSNPGIFYQFSTQTIQPQVPEPGTIVLAGLGALGLALAWKRRK
jgi:hypothetical protein